MYAPTSASSDVEIDEFYATVQESVESVPSRDLLIIMGDLNAKVGKDWNTWYGVIGQFRYGEENKKLSYRRETARQLPTWRGLSPPVHSPFPSGYTYAYGRIRNPQQTYMYVKRAVHKAHFNLNRAFKVI